MAADAPGNKALIFIMLTVLIDTIGFGVVIPVFPELIMELADVDLSRAAVVGGWLMFLFAFMQFFFAPILGNLSDRFGRRPILLISLFAFGIDYVLMGFAPTLMWLFIGRALAGVFGATFATANAYISDTTPPDKRAQSFGLLGAAWGLGFILGPAIGGFLGEYGARIPFFAAAGLALVNVLYGFFVLPETLPKENRRPFSLARANPVGTLRQMVHYPGLIGFFVVVALFQLAHDSLPTTWSYFAMESFDWSERDVGMSLGFVGVTSIIVQAWLIRVIVARLGELRTVIFGLVFFGLAFVVYAFATQGWMLYVGIVVMGLGGVASPALRGLMSNRVPADAQGELHGSVSAIVSLTMIVTPLMMPWIFQRFTREAAAIYFPGAPYLTSAVLVAVCLTVFLAVTRMGSGVSPCQDAAD